MGNEVKLNAIKAADLSGLITATLERPFGRLTGAPRTLMILGKPGVGKSSIVAQAAAGAGYDMVTLFAALSDPTDFKGMPALTGADRDEAEFVPFGELKRLTQATEPLVVFLDEIGKAPISVQNAAAQLILNREVNGTPIPDCVVFILASNRKSDRAGENSVPSHLLSRCIVLELVEDLPGWTDYMLGKGFGAIVPTFLSYRPELFNNFNPMSQEDGYACPRAWTALAEWVEDTGTVPRPVAYGTVGSGAGAEFLAFLDLAKELPALSKIIADPDGASLPTSPGGMYCLCGALANRVRQDLTAWPSVARYAKRLTGDFRELLLVITAKMAPAITDTREYGELKTS
jgi:hypothetical protein